MKNIKIIKINNILLKLNLKLNKKELEYEKYLR